MARFRPLPPGAPEVIAPLAPLLERLGPRRRLGLLLGILLLLALLLVPGAGLLLVPLHAALVRSFGLVVDLVVIGLLLFLLAAFLAPLESLGWWAGWFGEELRPPLALGDLARPLADERAVRCWVVYLDGIGQASDQALPEGEDFLRRLAGRLPEDIAVVRGIMPYSVLNRPMTEGRGLARVWRWLDRLRLRHPRSLLGVFINLRNLTVVAVSADRRYGPIYNQGLARVILDTLMAQGYRPGSGVPLCLLGFSGGGQIALGALPHLRRALDAPIEVISLGGVFAGNNRFLQVEHLFHLVGQRDGVARIGPIAFPGRWPWMLLSFWNRARRQGKVSLVDLGPVGHQLPGGLLDDRARLPDGRSPMEQTLELVSAILLDQLPSERPPATVLSNYRRFRANPWHRLDLSRDCGPLPAPCLSPRDGWIGRLILPRPRPPALRQQPFELDFEVFAAPPQAAHLVGHIVRLVWDQPALRRLTMDVRFSEEARHSERMGGIHPSRLDGWRAVTPLESLAGARPEDDMLVRLPEPVRLELGRPHRLVVGAEPIQTTGLARGLVRFEAPDPGGEEGGWWAVPYDPVRRDFAGERLRLRLPEPIANGEGIRPSSARELASVPLNAEGWYVCGVPDGQGGFLVQALAPRALLRFAPQRLICGRASWRYLRHGAWSRPRQGQVTSVLVSRRRRSEADLLADWRAGQRLLLVHVYGGIGGEQREQALRWGLCVGHFAYGVAELHREPLADELSLALQYRQVYAHNPEGLVAGAHDLWRYLADRQWGWLGTRPVADVLVHFPPFTGSYRIAGEDHSPLELFERQLAAMMARYRLGDGSGAAFVGLANNCAQDSNQALFAALRELRQRCRAAGPELLQRWRREDPQQAERLRALMRLERDLRRALLPFGGLRRDWLRQDWVLGRSLEDHPIDDVVRGLGSWRTALPRLASDTVLRVFLRHGATALVLRSDQPGGWQPTIEPVAPLTL
ncbi:MAG: hypothetical protein VKK62_07470 [Synechococcaceae cyanobacterium]|nr:hypothetical protein [Synechococcaceae cyanobacterium]